MHDYLKDVPVENSFRLPGSELFNLYDLLDALEEMTEEEYSHYVGEGFNHFANWIRDIVKDDVLAESLDGIRDREMSIDILEQRIHELSEPKKEEAVKEAEPKAEEHPTTKVVEEKVEEEPALVTHAKHHEHKAAEHKIKVYHDEEETRTHERLRKALGSKYDRFVAREFMQGMAIGIIIGMILAKILQIG